MKFNKILTLAAILAGALFSPLYQAGIIHVNGNTVLPNSSPGTVGSTVEYKELSSGKPAGNTILGSDGKYTLNIDVDLSGINVNTTVNYSARAFGNSIVLGSADVKKIDVFNTSGQLVKKVNFSVKNGITQGSFDTNGLSSGMYFVNVVSAEGRITLKTNILEGQSSDVHDFTNGNDIKNSLNEKSTFLTNNYEVKIISPAGEYKTFLDTLTFTVPTEGNESWESPIHALQYDESANYIYGYVQKGPFITGSTILIQELNTALSPNGTSFNISTEDNFGSFYLESEISTDFIEVICTGYYFNEVTGNLSESYLTLRTITAVEDTLNCNINILTSLAKKRIVYLATTGGKTFAEAKQQAQNEILAIFNINGAGAADFEDMDISSYGDSNGMLLAISAILQGNNTVAELSLLISTITEDIKIDGILNDTASKNEIIENAKFLSLPSVRNNIEDRYEDLGLTTVIPNFEQYINNIWANTPPTIQITKLECIEWPDTLSAFSGDPLLIGRSAKLAYNTMDVDGSILQTKIYLDNTLVNSTSTGTYTWTIADTTKFHTIKVITFDDDGAMSLADSVNYQLHPYQWIKTASNETLWDEYGTAPAEINAVSLNNKMFVYNRNLGIMYSSINGANWIIETDSVPWEKYGTFVKKAYDNKIWVIKNNIFWYSSDGINWFEKNVTLPPIFYEAEPFIYNDSFYLLFADEGGQIKICKMENDSLITVSPAIPDLGMPSLVGNVEFNNNLYFYRIDGGTWVKYSQDIENWTHNSDIFPFDNWSTKMVVVDNKIYAFPTAYGPTYVPSMWNSDDGLSWSRNILLAPMLHDVMIFNNSIWAFENDYDFNVYKLKKYFD